MRLKDKVAIITGSSRGLGKLYAERFAEEGAKVTVCDVTDCGEAVKAIKAIGGEVLALKTDVTKVGDTVEMVKKTVERFGKIDILVNNAAIYGGLRLQPFYEVDENEWDKVMAVNLKGMWLCCKAVFPYMKEQGHGKIINISSGVHFKGIPYFIHYTTSKGGVVAFTRAMARELGEYNINVNAVAPGLMLTKASNDMFSPELAKKDTATQALHKEQKPEYVVGTVLFLASEDSDYLTGQTIVVDGGTFMH
jgi:NAD(P)-dependent dehydrogenase (short-subunit alcohol dehydrogenase family)